MLSTTVYEALDNLQCLPYPKHMFRSQTMTTKHTCGGPVFGKKTPGCPRCDELLAGAKPVQWAIQQRRARDEQFRRDLAAHDCKRSHCMPVCTFGDW